VRTAAVASSKASKTVKAAKAAKAAKKSKAAKAAKKSKAAGKAAPAKAHPAVKPGPASNGKVKKSAAAELTAREAAGPELIKRVVDDLRVQSKHRPRTRKTLENRVASLLNGKIEKGAEPHIVDTVAELGAVRFDGVRAVYDDARLATLTTS
jgi:hypothetical protein